MTALVDVAGNSVKKRLHCSNKIVGNPLVHVLANIQPFDQLVLVPKHLQQQRSEFLLVERLSNHSRFTNHIFTG